MIIFYYNLYRIMPFSNSIDIIPVILYDKFIRIYVNNKVNDKKRKIDEIDN